MGGTQLSRIELASNDSLEVAVFFGNNNLGPHLILQLPPKLKGLRLDYCGNIKTLNLQGGSLKYLELQGAGLKSLDLTQPAYQNLEHLLLFNNNFQSVPRGVNTLPKLKELYIKADLVE